MQNNVVVAAGSVKMFSDTHVVMVARVVDQFIGVTIPSGIQNSGSQVLSTGIPMIEIGSMSIEKAVSHVGRDLHNTALMSMDGLFCPYVINITGTGHSTLPSWISATSTDINATDLNPFNPSNIFSTGTNHFNTEAVFRSGSNIAYQNRLEAVGAGTSGNVFLYNEIYDNNTGNFNTIKAVGLKAPLVLTGWGYDTNGKPVPADTGNPEAFASGAFRNPTLWKSGPLDARWDNDRQVWSVGSTTKVYLSKVTNTYNTPDFSYEIDRTLNRDQFTRYTPRIRRAFSASANIYDPESIAYSANPENRGTYEQLNYMGLEFPHYEAFIIRETVDDVSPEYYNIWTEDSGDCGHLANPCSGDAYGNHGSSSLNRKILIENPLKQNLQAGDLCFTMKTGRSKKVNSGFFIGGSGVQASGRIDINSVGSGTFITTSAGSGYTNGAFAIVNSGISTSISLILTSGAVTSGTLLPNIGFPPSRTYDVTIYPANAMVETEKLDIHWIMQAEFKSQQVVSHVVCDGGLLQTCVVKLQTQGFKSCEWCGEDTALVNSF